MRGHLSSGASRRDAGRPAFGRRAVEASQYQQRRDGDDQRRGELRILFHGFLLRCVGGVALCLLSNRAHCRRRGQGERGEIRFSEISGWKIFLLSAACASPFGAPTSLASRSRREPDAPIGRPISTSRARRLLPMRLSWPCSTSFDRASARDSQILPQGAVSTSECPVVTERLVSCRDHSPRGYAAVNADQLGWGSNRPSSGANRKERFGTAVGVTAGETALNSSSGDGLGNHQPGSMTCGFAIARQPASGRARDRAICPAVARFIDRSAA
jgi:hypothetical protein